MNIANSGIFAYARINGEAYLKYTDYNPSPRNRNKLACILAMLADADLKPGATRIIEVGCGLGNVALPLASLGYVVTGMDVHEPSINESRRRNTFANMTFIAGDALEHDLADYEVVILSDVLEHIPGCADFLRNLVLRMKAGAYILLTVPNGWNISEIMLRPSYRIKPTRAGKKIVKCIKRILRTRDMTTANEETPHVNFFTLDWLGRMFADCRLESVQFISFFRYWTLWETFFSERKVPDHWPEKDFHRSLKMRPQACAEWAFLLRKKSSIIQS